uniref:Uncharacterized protein n=1 Tax=Arundo donax TaxID=35708 RepID=A0A0A8XQX7_ARUDO
MYMICTRLISVFSTDIDEALVQICKSTPASPSKRYDRPTMTGRPGASSRYAECPLTRPHLATAVAASPAAASSSSICSSTRRNASASHGSASGPAAAYPNASSASSSSARNSGWFTHLVRTTNRCRPAPTHTVKQPSGAGFLRALRHRSSVFMISPSFLPLSMATASFLRSCRRCVIVSWQRLVVKSKLLVKNEKMKDRGIYIER